MLPALQPSCLAQQQHLKEFVVAELTRVLLGLCCLPLLLLLRLARCLLL
jgi:hypothetical protein